MKRSLARVYFYKTSFFLSLFSSRPAVSSAIVVDAISRPRAGSPDLAVSVAAVGPSAFEQSAILRITWYQHSRPRHKQRRRQRHERNRLLVLSWRSTCRVAIREGRGLQLCWASRTGRRDNPTFTPYTCVHRTYTRHSQGLVHRSSYPSSVVL